MSLPPDRPAHRSGTDLGEHLSLLRRRWLLLLGCVLAGGTTGLALLRCRPPSYTATTQLLVTPVGVSGAGQPGDHPAARAPQPRHRGADRHVLRRRGQGRPRVNATALEPAEVSVPPNSSVLSISYTAADPATAAASRGPTPGLPRPPHRERAGRHPRPAEAPAGQAPAGQHLARRGDQTARRAGLRGRARGLAGAGRRGDAAERGAPRPAAQDGA